MRKVLSLIFVTTIACSGASLSIGCTGDDSSPATPGSDSGSDGPITFGDGGPPGDSGPPGDGGGGDANCNYATFVTDLITNHTNGTDQPSTDLGQGCIDNQNQAEFKPLFP